MKRLFKNHMNIITIHSVILALCIFICACVPSGTSDNSSYSDVQNYSGQTETNNQADLKDRSDESISTDTADTSDESVLIEPSDESVTSTTYSSAEIPEFAGKTYVVLDNNIPVFTDEEKTSTEAFELYSDPDELGRCGTAYANICKDLMPTGERESIGMVKPAGWHLVKYDCVDGKYLYNRCHLIAFMLAGENANEKNLITGTRYFNVNGMLPFENMVGDYVKDTGNHVLYRVTPLYDGDDLIARGVKMEGYSVEDEGRGICFNVFVYNVQPGIVIDYHTGDSYYEEGSNLIDDSYNSGDAAKDSVSSYNASKRNIEQTYILNTNTKKFHLPSCSSVHNMKKKNKKEVTAKREDLINEGYEPCKSCNP